MGASSYNEMLLLRVRNDVRYTVLNEITNALAMKGDQKGRPEMLEKVAAAITRHLRLQVKVEQDSAHSECSVACNAVTVTRVTVREEAPAVREEAPAVREEAPTTFRNLEQIDNEGGETEGAQVVRQRGGGQLQGLRVHAQESQDIEEDDRRPHSILFPYYQKGRAERAAAAKAAAENAAAAQAAAAAAAASAAKVRSLFALPVQRPNSDAAHPHLEKGCRGICCCCCWERGGSVVGGGGRGGAARRVDTARIG